MTVDGSQLDRLVGHPQLSGEVTISILARADPPQSFTDPFTNVPIQAQGTFIGYRYSVSNETNAELQPATQINDELRLTDGSRSWPTADYTGTHSQDVSGSWSETKGDEQAATFVAAGFEQSTWAVFDVPLDANPTGLALPLVGGQACIGVPR